MTVPAVILLASALNRLGPTWRLDLAGVFLVTGFAAASLDQGNAVLAPHRVFLSEPYATDSVLEPFEYVGARWVAGWTKEVPCGCATDLGRGLVVRQLTRIGGKFAPTTQARYAVFSPQ